MTHSGHSWIGSRGRKIHSQSRSSGRFKLRISSGGGGGSCQRPANTQAVPSKFLHQSGILNRILCKFPTPVSLYSRCRIHSSLGNSIKTKQAKNSYCHRLCLKQTLWCPSEFVRDADVPTSGPLSRMLQFWWGHQVIREFPRDSGVFWSVAIWTGDWLLGRTIMNRRTKELAQWVKTLAAQAWRPNLVPMTHTAEGQTNSHSSPPASTCMPCRSHAYTQICTYTQIKRMQ